jgi:hypothetical protein
MSFRNVGKVRNLRRTGPFVGVCVAMGGCTALLGDYTSGGVVQASDAGTSTSSDGGISTSDGPGSGDAQIDGAVVGDAALDGALAPLACTTWRYPEPLILETLSSGTRRVDGALRVFALLNQQVRVIAGKNSGIPFTVYTVDSSQTPAIVTLLNAQSAGDQSFVTAHRSPSAVSPYISIASYSRPLGGTGTYYAYSLPDTMPVSGPIPNAFPIYGETTASPSTVGDAIFPFSTTDLFTAIAYPTATAPTNYVLGVGRATSTLPLTPTTLATVATSPNEDDVSRVDMFHANGSVYLFDENDESDPGLSTWTVPDTATATAPPAKRAVSAANPASIVAIGENVADTTNPSANVMYEESTVVGTFTNAITFRAGTIPYASPDAGSHDLDSWVSTDLPQVKISTNVYTAPVGVATASVWVNDNIMLIGSGLRNGNTGVVMPGLNVVWVDSTGTVRGEQIGANNLLSTLDDFTAASAAPISTSLTAAKWAVTWVETKSDDAGEYDVVQYNELDCQAASPEDAGAP